MLFIQQVTHIHRQASPLGYLIVEGRIKRVERAFLGRRIELFDADQGDAVDVFRAGTVLQHQVPDRSYTLLGII